MEHLPTTCTEILSSLGQPTRSSFLSLARTMTMTRGTLNTTWPMITVARVSGILIMTKNSINATPIMISGMTRGGRIALSMTSCRRAPQSFQPQDAAHAEAESENRGDSPQ